MNKKIIITSLLLLLGSYYPLKSQIFETEDPEIGIVEQLDTFMPQDIQIIDENGERQLLKERIDKPTILNFVYYRCPGICSPLMTGIAEVIQKSDMVLGQDFQVLTISFDPSEPAELAKKKRTNYLNLIDKEIDASGWQFFVADSLDILKMTQATGYKYKKTGNDFLHPATIMVLSPEGKITRYLNGTYFLPFEVKMAIVEASQGISGPTINKILQYCYTYDPVGQQYVLNVTKISATIILFIGLIILLVLALKPRKKTKTN